MNTDKRILIFLILSAAILMISRSFAPPPPPAGTMSNVRGSVPQPVSESSDTTIVSDKDLQSTEIGKFTVSYSLSSGYIDNIYLTESNTRLPIENVFYTPEFTGAGFNVQQSGDTLTFTHDTPTGVIIKEYSYIEPDALEVKVLGLESFSDVVIFEQPDEVGPSARYQELVYKTDTIHKKHSSSVSKPLKLNELEYVGLRGRYYAVAVLNPQGTYTVNRVDHSLRLSKESLPEGTTRIFVGPQTGSALAQYDLDDMVSYGVLTPIVVALKFLLSFFAGLFNNWGISIILLAFVVYAICFPLTAKSTQSMRKMQEFQPHMEALREKHKDDPQRLQKEMIELYRKYQINPMSGCLPLLLQMPIFIALYQLMFRMAELQGAGFLWIEDLSRPDYLVHLPVELPLIGDGIHLLPVLMGALTFLQQKYTTKPNAMTEQQRMMLWMMPILLLFIFYSFPAALVLYWMTNSILTFSYQLYLSKTSK